MGYDVDVCYIGYDELPPALLLSHEHEHASQPVAELRKGRFASVCELVDVAQLLRLRKRHSRDHRAAGRRPRRCICTPARIG